MRANLMVGLFTLVVLWAVPGHVAFGRLITVNYSGALTEVIAGVPLSAGDRFSGSFQYDASAPGEFVESGEFDFHQFSALRDFSFSLDGWQSAAFTRTPRFDMTAGLSGVAVLAHRDELQVPDLSPAFGFNQVALSLFGVITPGRLPDYDFTAELTEGLVIFDFNPIGQFGFFQAYGTIDQLSVSLDDPVIPEPATLTLVGIGVLPLLVRRRIRV